MAEIKQTINTTARMVLAISKNRCGWYSHLCKDFYKMRPKGPIYNKNEARTPKFPKRNPRR